VEAMTLAHRMVVMNQGVPEQIGTPAEVFERPASLFVAGFIGSPPMNLLRVQRDAQGRAIGLQGEVLPFQVPAGAPASLVLGLRPEHLRLATQGLQACIEMIEILGSEALVHARWGEQPLILRCAVAETRTQPLAIGDLITLAPDGQHPVHWFDAETGRRIDAAAMPESGAASGQHARAEVDPRLLD